MRFPLVVLIAMAVAGCGYRGPLYLPKPKPAAVKPAVKPQPAPEPPSPTEGPAVPQ